MEKIKTYSSFLAPLARTLFFVFLLAFYFYGVLYERAESSKLIEQHNISSAMNYVSVAQENIKTWKEFNEMERASFGPDSNIEAILNDLKEGLEKNNQLIKAISADRLSNTWQIYFNYFRAYLLFICADVKGDKSCSKDSLRVIKQTEALNQSSLTSEQLDWLAEQAIYDQLALLKAFASAILYMQEPYRAENKTNAIDSLMKLGSKEYLISAKVQEDRILGQIFKLAYDEPRSN